MNQTNQQFRGKEEFNERFKIWKDTVKKVAEENKLSGNAHYTALNKFADQTPAEKKQHLGFNFTANYNTVENTEIFEKREVPDEKMWLDGVAPAMDQGDCGSCWAFGATGSLESKYKILTGTFRKFSEQEFLDCTYRSKNGCDGGAPWDAWRWSRDENMGRLSSGLEYPYVGYRKICSAGDFSNAAVGAKITEWIRLHGEEASIQRISSSGAIMMSVHAKQMLFDYDYGIHNDDSCTSDYLDHAVTGVGYTKEYVLAKNSWGGDWGDAGFVKFARGVSNCNIYGYNADVVLAITEVKDDKESDPTTLYIPCADKFHQCKKSYCTHPYMKKFCRSTCGLCNKCDDLFPRCEKSHCRDPKKRRNCKLTCGLCNINKCYDLYHNCRKSDCKHLKNRQMCKLTCGLCDNDQCSAGTVKCADGQCRHVHMC